MASKIGIRLRMERAVRLQQAGLKQTEVANILGVTPVTLKNMEKTPEYQAIATSIATGIIAKLDDEMYNEEELRVTLKQQLLPAAIQTLADLVQQKRDDKIRLAAASEILDREGSFTKISKQISQTVASPLTSSDEEAVDEVVTSLKKNEKKSHVNTSNHPNSEAIQ